MRTLTPSDRRELLRAAYPVLRAIASGHLSAAGEMWQYAIDRLERCEIDIHAARTQAGAIRLVGYLESFEAGFIR